MAIQPVIGDKYFVTWAQLEKPTVKGHYKVTGLGTLILDDADVHYANKNPDIAAFFVRKSKALGPNMLVVVARHLPDTPEPL